MLSNRILILWSPIWFSNADHDLVISFQIVKSRVQCLIGKNSIEGPKTALTVQKSADGGFAITFRSLPFKAN